MAPHRFRSSLGIMVMLAGGLGATWAQSQRLAIVGCTSSPPAVPGYECEKAFDGNPATEWRVQALPGSGQTIRLNFAALRRVKKITATWGSAPNMSRSYITVDKDESWRWVSTVTGSQATDDVPLSWGEDLVSDGGNMIWHSQSVVIEAYSSAVAGLREISIFGPGIYSDNQILTHTFAIPAWAITDIEPSKTLTFSSSIPLSRIVGASAFLFGDDNSVHNLTALVPYPGTSYDYHGDGIRQSGFTIGGGNTIDVNARSLAGNVDFNDPAKFPRGYVTIRYLSQDPEFQP